MKKLETYADVIEALVTYVEESLLQYEVSFVAATIKDIVEGKMVPGMLQTWNREEYTCFVQFSKFTLKIEHLMRWLESLSE